MSKVKKKAKEAKPKKYECSQCLKTFADLSSYRHHIQLHSDDRPYSCIICKGTFKTSKYLSKHIKSVHTAPTDNECKECGKKFHFRCLLEKHRLVHTDEKPHKCKWCKKGFNSRYSLSCHILIHTDSKPFKCSVCDYACRDSSTLRKHEERHRGKIPTYTCKICDKQFSTKSVLRVHVTERHLYIDLKVKPCEECGKMFRNKTSLNTHVNIVHKRKYASECAVCGLVISNKQNMSQHLRTHVALRPYTCTFEGCEKAFKDPSTLKKHVIIHYPEKHFACKLCDRKFTRLSRFKKHKLQHKAKRKTVTCDYCGVSFYNKKYLTNHISRKHLYRTKYICDTCNFITYNKPSLVMHIKHGHVSEMDRQCKICKKTYKKHMYLKLHYWKVHCVKYKVRERIVKNKKVSKKEDCGDKMSVSVIKEEVASETEYSRNELDEDVNKLSPRAGDTSEQQLEDFYIKFILDKDKTPKKAPDPRINQEVEKKVRKKIRTIVKKSRRARERRELERARRTYNIRMESLLRKKEPEPIEIKKSEVSKIICEKDENGKLKFNAHQCYVCFTLYKTKKDLLDHCQQHFDVCNTTMLRKCPLCDYVSKLSLGPHLKKKHKLNVRLYTGNIKDKKNNKNGSRFYFDVKSKTIDKLEVIPSVKLLNKQAYVKLDRKNREKKDRMIVKTKLVKKGKEWIVEKEKLDIQNYIAPELDTVNTGSDVSKVGGDDYCGRMKRLSFAAKKNGGKILFPCDKCEKICQTMSALKLHYRRHDPSAKPFKPKVWKHKLKLENNVKSNVIDNVNTGIDTKRYAIPKPIAGKHKCDPNLMRFYENNIRGDNIEFWQFLKIYNRLTKEKIEDFSDLERRTDFGIHTSNSVTDNNVNGNNVTENNVTGNNVTENNVTENYVNGNNVTENNGNNAILKRTRLKRKEMQVLRRILISKKEHERRNEIKKRMRESLDQNKVK